MKRIFILLFLTAALIATLTACDALANGGDNGELSDDTSVLGINTDTESELMDEDADDVQNADEVSDENMSDEDAADGEDMTDEEAMSDGDDMADSDMADDDMASEYNGPDWTHIELVDARNGETFTLADFAGKTVYVEPMATWCSNCRSQLRRVRDAIPQLDSDQYVFIGISVESGLADSTLAEYTQTQEFDWPFAVAPDDMLQQMVDHYGRSITTPPSTPHFIISPDGTLSDLSTGSHSPEEIIDLMQSASMSS
ncbi:MAG: hypothetical protein CL607_01480 [Anaerolineaceae bacterium]|nr:hypothetical protein [Anaerolineaceae bacterium]